MASREDDIVQGIKTGNINSFKQLFDSYYDRLCNIANGYLNNKQLAEEVVGDVFFKIWENRKTFVVHTSLQAYLIRVVRNRCLNCLEQTKFERRFLSDAAIDFSREDFFTTDYQSPLSDLITDEIEAAIDKAVNSLPDECREIFKLSRFENLKYEEIALQKNISVNTVKTQMKIALAKLRQALQPFLPMLIWVMMV